MDRPKVSVIVPCWRVEQYLNKCVECLVSQTLNDIEIILVDDESPDRVPEMCDEWVQKDYRIKVIHKKNGGLGYARNSGVEIATGEYVTFCDSDDWLDCEAYETVYNIANKKNLDICWFQFRRIRDDGSILGKSKEQEEYFLDESQMIGFRKDMIGRNPANPKSKTRNMSSCMALFKRNLYIDTGIRYPSEREVASEDYVFLLNLLPHVKRVGIIPNVFYNYRLNPCSISSSYSEAKYIRLLNMLKVCKKHCQENYKWNEIKNHYYSQQLRIFKVILRYESIGGENLWHKIKRIKNETSNSDLTDLYNDSVRNKYGLFDRILIFFMKYHLAIPIIIMYKLKK